MIACLLFFATTPCEKYFKCQLTFYTCQVFHEFIIDVSKLMIKINQRKTKCIRRVIVHLIIPLFIWINYNWFDRGFSGHDKALKDTKWQKRIKYKNLLMINANANDYDD